MDVAYDLVLRENLSPPAAARVYAYVAVGMYEATVAGIPTGVSLSGQLNGYRRQPISSQAGRLDWPSVVAHAAHRILTATLPFQSATASGVLASSLSDYLAGRSAAGVSAHSLAASSAHADAVTRQLISWIDLDGYAGTVGRAYDPPTGDAMWVSTPPNYRPAIEPYWSEVRPLTLRAPDEVAPAAPIPFDPDPASAFGQQAMAPYLQSFKNGTEEKAIARFWTDNPGSFTPPLGTPTGLPSGHWMQIASIALREKASRLDTAVQAYARVGIALHDAFVNCWTWKYRYNLLRPITYINRYVDPAWTTFVNSPQFPEYSSGHSVASPAAAVALTQVFGEMAFVDDSPVPRGHLARSFTSFDDAAREAARSRLYGGIHYPMAIENGFAQGAELGALVQSRITLLR